MSKCDQEVGKECDDTSTPAGLQFFNFQRASCLRQLPAPLDPQKMHFCFHGRECPNGGVK